MRRVLSSDSRLGFRNSANCCNMREHISEMNAKEVRNCKVNQTINVLNLETGILLTERKKINIGPTNNSATNTTCAEDDATLLLQKSATLASLRAAASALATSQKPITHSFLSQPRFWTCQKKLCRQHLPLSSFSRAIERHGKSVFGLNKICNSCIERLETVDGDALRENLQLVQRLRR